MADAPDLDITGKIPDIWRGAMSLRWVLVHMIEEYARHLGHADLLRERIDGAVGQQQPFSDRPFHTVMTILPCASPVAR